MLTPWLLGFILVTWRNTGNLGPNIRNILVTWKQFSCIGYQSCFNLQEKVENSGNFLQSFAGNFLQSFAGNFLQSFDIFIIKTIRQI